MFEPGDIVACYGTDWPSRGISLATASLFPPRRLMVGPSHVAILCEHFRWGMVWVESTSFAPRPCLTSEGTQPTYGVQMHLPLDRINDYVANGGSVDLYRLTDINRLTQDESELLTTILVRHFVDSRKTYDMRGAALSGMRRLKATRCFPGADLEKIFCSELIAATLQRLNRMNRENPSKFNPACMMRRLVRDGVYRWHTNCFDHVRLFEPAEAVTAA